MFYALNWFVVAVFLALWSIAAWALHAVAVWAVSSSGALSGAASGVATMALPDWLAPWVPPEIASWATELLAGLRHVIDSLLQAAPNLAGGVTVATLVAWGIGSVLLVLLGAGLHLLIALWRRRGGGSPGSNKGPALAAG